MQLQKAKEPFKFYTRLNLTELTGLFASNLRQIVRHIKKVPVSSIYHHTHRFLQQRQYHSPEPPNDFAYWISNVLGEKELSEQLASIDMARFSDINSLRNAIVEIIDLYLKKNFLSGFRHLEKNEAFCFMKSVSFILPTSYVVTDLKEFMEALKNITTDSIYFHTFEARLRIGRETNDFSDWIKYSIGNKKLADEISRLDPYTHTLEELRMVMIRLVEKQIGG
ncbi:MAG: hypothetical protein KJ584_02040 [Candidatus Omnitrophica bacterium]|nr:hypothetical protein [Candidatus Omnitrophota bacterium]MBU1809284.1 hypothetical protein [Candidatus Omnitrophota bacterium]